MNIKGLRILVCSVLTVSVAAQDSDCDFFQNIREGETYYIYNKEYPNYYKAGTRCRWIAQSQANTKISLSCSDINIPSSQNCNEDRLSISLTGDSSFSDAQNYCGVGNLNLKSIGNKLAIGLFATWYSKGGRISCTVTAVRDSNPCPCGYRQYRKIVGGVETGVNEYPYMAGIIEFKSRSLLCGATIIANRYALTAAHCVFKKYAPDHGLLVGDHDITTGSDTSYASVIALQSFIVHESYNEAKHLNDIAIVQTDKVIQFSMFVGPVCLPFLFRQNDMTGATLTMLGWGTIEFSGPRSDRLLAANVTAIDNYSCQKKMTGDQIYDSEICHFTYGKDACQHDSGGPLIYRANGDQLIGIIIYGKGCGGDYPGVNTRVTSYLNWIASSTPDVQYCAK